MGSLLDRVHVDLLAEQIIDQRFETVNAGGRGVMWVWPIDWASFKTGPVCSGAYRCNAETVCSAWLCSSGGPVLPLR